MEELSIKNPREYELQDLVREVARVVEWLEAAATEIDIAGPGAEGVALVVPENAATAAAMADTFGEAKSWLAEAQNALRRRWLQLLPQEERDQVSADEIAAIGAGRPPQSLEEQIERLMNDPTDAMGRQLRKQMESRGTEDDR